MEEVTKTKGARHIEQLMQHLEPDSERYRVLASAKRFKSSWVELGEWLARVSNGRQYAAWGFASFEDYCAKEVRLRRQTAEKLLLAYRFLERREPALLQSREERPLPDYRSVDLLRQADEGQHFSMEAYSELRRSVVEEERNHPAIARQFRDIAQAGEPEAASAHRQRNALIAARRLATSLQGIEGVPGTLSQAVVELISLLESQTERLEQPPHGNNP